MVFEVTGKLELHSSKSKVFLQYRLPQGKQSLVESARPNRHTSALRPVASFHLDAHQAVVCPRRVDADQVEVGLPWRGLLGLDVAPLQEPHGEIFRPIAHHGETSGMYV